MLKTYDRTYSDGEQGAIPDPWPFVHYDSYGDPTCDGPLKPGDWIKHETRGGKGMVVAVNDDNLTILWSFEPADSVNFSKFVMPLVRRVNYASIGQKLVSVQPMSLPSGLIFYMDYVHGDKWHQRCTTGPWPVRMFWKGCRWVRDRGASTWSWLKVRLRPQLPAPKADAALTYEQKVITEFGRLLKEKRSNGRDPR